MKEFFFFVLISSAYSSDFTYKSTDNTGLNKFDRINQIEKFLSTLDKGIGKVQKDLNSTDSLILKDLQATKKNLKNLEQQYRELSQSIPKENKKQDTPKLQKELDDLKKKNETLENKVNELEISLKTLKELFDRNQELKQRTNSP
jgi:chromosome segregation ATPase